MPDKLYYTIGEVAEMLSVNPSLIRFWEKEFTFLKPQKNKKGNRLFTSRDIDNLRMIYNLVKIKGYTIQGAREHLHKSKAAEEKNLSVIKSLEEIKRFLKEIEKELP